MDMKWDRTEKRVGGKGISFFAYSFFEENLFTNSYKWIYQFEIIIEL